MQKVIFFYLKNSKLPQVPSSAAKNSQEPPFSWRILKKQDGTALSELMSFNYN